MKELIDLRDDISQLKGRLLERESRLTTILKSKDEIQKELVILNESVQLAKKCLEVNLTQKKYIEDIISKGLTDVFGIEHTFVLEPVCDSNGLVKGLKPLIREGNGELDDPLTSIGAGAQAISSVCFKIAILLMSTGTAKVLILDEPLANVSPMLQHRFKAFVENICRETGLQLVMITHMDEPFGKVYKVVKETKNKKTSSKIVVVDNE